MTIEDLAKAIGIAPENMGKIERGVHNVSLQSLRKLAMVLQVPVLYLGCFEDMPEETIGQRIKKARYTLGMTKKELSFILGVNPKTVHNWERGTTSPSHEQTNKIMALLKE
jgi:transcriptional regulator with XRE-family HTH domain